ncbi:ImmA/IrrE family metallo-endopeptidase [Acinetobacter radioresistens]|jgi:Zn-dependent peptidase ImmA (M78 family)|uniref:ImmA/IrrE family metallo-endopeptidase n=1 Tax=Acinetobacter TaxID=469 RepID=UPI000EA31D71|nr:ImmA/IrrE family metallo-endopeptidase [Acinetobacter cumulans]RKG49426.1 ImmA/IrrE family metallo-endopeptidase [Acinetobacter cumulans]
MKINVTISNEWNSLCSEYQQLLETHQTTYPVQLGAIAKALGIKILSSTLRSDISGEIRETNGEVTIKVNRHDAKTRQRFTVAHELAHYFLHRDLLKDGIVDDVLYRSSHSTSIEQEANRLAADILMPIHLLNKLVLQCNHEKETSRKIEYLAQELNVSITALKIRLG